MFALFMGLKSVSPRALHGMMQTHPVAVFDVNSPPSWAREHVPGAVNLDPVHYAADALPPDKAQSLVFYYSNPMCRKAPNAALRAKKLGYTNAMVMTAGISGWLAASLPTQPG